MCSTKGNPANASQQGIEYKSKNQSNSNIIESQRKRILVY